MQEEPGRHGGEALLIQPVELHVSPPPVDHQRKLSPLNTSEGHLDPPHCKGLHLGTLLRHIDFDLQGIRYVFAASNTCQGLCACIEEYTWQGDSLSEAQV